MTASAESRHDGDQVSPCPRYNRLSAYFGYSVYCPPVPGAYLRRTQVLLWSADTSVASSLTTDGKYALGGLPTSPNAPPIPSALWADPCRLPPSPRVGIPAHMHLPLFRFRNPLPHPSRSRSSMLVLSCPFWPSGPSNPRRCSQHRAPHPLRNPAAGIETTTAGGSKGVVPHPGFRQPLLPPR